MVRINALLIILLCVSACQQTLVSSAPVEPTLTPTAEQLLAAAPRSGREIPTTTASPLVFPVPSTQEPVDDVLLTQVAVPALTATLPPDTVLVGQSVEGRSILARSFGNGDKRLLLVGGMHGGWEANTVTLINQLMTHFETEPDDVLPGMTITLIPVANPDGLLRGREEAGRFNTNGVDLNRNWGCEWSEDAVWRNQYVNPGERSFSEPETLAIAAYIQQTQPATVLFYHSAAGGVFAGNCNGDHGSALMSQILGQATGYTYGQPFTTYRVTGTAASWVDGEGIPSADVELLSWDDSEFERNLRGVMTLQEWLSS